MRPDAPTHQGSASHNVGHGSQPVRWQRCQCSVRFQHPSLPVLPSQGDIASSSVPASAATRARAVITSVARASGSRQRPVSAVAITVKPQSASLPPPLLLPPPFAAHLCLSLSCSSASSLLPLPCPPPAQAFQPPTVPRARALPTRLWPRPRHHLPFHTSHHAHSHPNH